MIAPAGAEPGAPPDAITWRPLAQFCVLRIAVSGSLLILGSAGPALRPLGARNLDAFLTVSATWLALALLALALARWRRPRFAVQALVQVATDVVALTLLMHTSGGVGSGLGILLVPVVAGGALLLSQRQGLALASLGSVAVLAEHLASTRLEPSADASYTQAGLLGAGLFFTALIAYQLAARARRSALLADQRREALDQLARLNAEVIRRMQTGIVLTEDDGRVLLSNPSAERLLGTVLPADARLGERLPVLGRALARWQAGGRATQPVEVADESAEYAPRFAHLGASNGHQGRVLVFLEDRAALRQQAQLLKLAGLGRLAASIAHQIRNPLTAVRQGLGLLREQPQLTADALELLDIADRNAARLGDIVSEILAMGRRPQQQAQMLALETWLARWRDDYAVQRALPAGRVAVDCPAPLTVRFDPGHLSQVLGNLCDNALSFCAADAPVLLRAHMDDVREQPVIEITDRGPGIAPGQRALLFEPFSSTRVHGTGLGLYVVRQLCEANQARVEYFDPPGGGAGFRIVCADPRRAQYA